MALLEVKTSYASGANVLTIDAGGIRALITHYATHRTDLGNEKE